MGTDKVEKAMQQLKLYTEVRKALRERMGIQQRVTGPGRAKEGVSRERAFQVEDQSKDPNRAYAFKEQTSQTSQSTSRDTPAPTLGMSVYAESIFAYAVTVNQTMAWVLEPEKPTFGCKLLPLFSDLQQVIGLLRLMCLIQKNGDNNVKLYLIGSAQGQSIRRAQDWGSNTQHSDHSEHHGIPKFKAAKKLDLNCSHHKKRNDQLCDMEKLFIKTMVVIILQNTNVSY